jgi:hypothetical protein
MFIGDVNGRDNINGTFAWFYFYDCPPGGQPTSTGWVTRQYMNSPGTFKGGTAEWIVERPALLNNPLPNLANYGSLFMPAPPWHGQEGWVGAWDTTSGFWSPVARLTPITAGYMTLMDS